MKDISLPLNKEKSKDLQNLVFDVSPRPLNKLERKTLHVQLGGLHPAEGYVEVRDTEVEFVFYNKLQLQACGVMIVKHVPHKLIQAQNVYAQHITAQEKQDQRRKEVQARHEQESKDLEDFLENL